MVIKGILAVKVGVIALVVSILMLAFGFVESLIVFVFVGWGILALVAGTIIAVMGVRMKAPSLKQNSQ